ncbi:hypothetical protein HPB47_000938, partial [Ixodes persulcatus]
PHQDLGRQFASVALEYKKRGHLRRNGRADVRFVARLVITAVPRYLGCLAHWCRLPAFRNHRFA